VISLAAAVKRLAEAEMPDAGRPASLTRMTTTFEPVTDASTFRRIAAATWGKPSDPSIYGAMDLDVSETLPFIERFRAETGRRLTITHVVARAVAEVFRRHPELNAKIRLGGRIERRKTVDVFVSVAAEGGKDLSGVRIAEADRLSLADLVDQVESGARGVRKGTDASYQRSRDGLKAMPFWLVGPALCAIDILTNELHLDLPKHGMPCDPLGSAVVTNVGTFGIDLAFAPFVPLGRCSMLLLLSEIKPRPMVIDGKVVARPTLRISGTFDHRIVDGFAAGKVAKILRELVEHPAASFDLAPPVGDHEARQAAE
jgi:pyruvate/2-oxoglutarate dehydrogenase complex dihydrolipoamide acyltransferase (E2) component